MNNKKIMKRSIFLLFLCVCLICSLCACGGKTDSGGDAENPAVSQSGENAITKLSRGCSNEYGYYNCNGSLIHFFDIKSKQKIVLCNNPNCKHDSAECNAYVYSKAAPENEIVISTDSEGEMSLSEDYSSTMFIFAEGDRLCILLTDGTMLSMKYDGTDRKTVAEIDSKYSFGTGESYKLGREIIMRAYYSVQEQGEIVEKTCFITYNIDTHKWKQGAAFDRITANRARVKGITSDKEAIFYHSDEPILPPQGTPTEERIRLINNTKCKLYSVNVETGERKDIFSGTLGDCSDVTMLNEKIYIYSENKKQLCEMDAKTGETTVLLEN